MEQELKTHYYFYSNEEGDGYEVYFCDYPHIKAFGDTYEEAWVEAQERMKEYFERVKDLHE